MTDSNTHNEINFISPIELARLLAVSRTTIYRIIEQRRIPFYKINGVIRFKKVDVDRFIESGRIESMS